MIDELDRRLIVELTKDGRRSYVDLARQLNVTETTIRTRVKHLLDKGVISITAALNLETLGYNFVGIVGLQIRLSYLQSIAKQLAKYPNVCWAANVTGRYDFMIIVAARSSKEFADFMESKVSVISGIIRTETFVNLNFYKGKTTGLDTMHLIHNLDIAERQR